MKLLSTLPLLSTAAWLHQARSFVMPDYHGKLTATETISQRNLALSMTSTSRHQVLRRIVGGAAGVCLVSTGASMPAYADVSDGTALPKEANQFRRVVRLKDDIKAVQKRVAEGASEMDSKEWDGVSNFLRQVYATGDDMKAITGGVASPDNLKRALNDIEQLRKYSRAADVSASRKDGPGFVAICDKMIELVGDFFDSLSDVPDEI